MREVGAGVLGRGAQNRSIPFFIGLCKKIHANAPGDCWQGGKCETGSCDNKEQTLELTVRFCQKQLCHQAQSKSLKHRCIQDSRRNQNAGSNGRRLQGGMLIHHN